MLPRNHGQFWILTFGPNYQLVVRLYNLIVTFPCSHFLHTFAPRKHVIWVVVLTNRATKSWHLALFSKICRADLEPVFTPRSRVWISLTVGEEDELEEDDEQWLSCLEGVLEVDEDPEDEFDKPGTTMGTKFSVLHGILIPFLMRCGFWPLIHSQEYPFSSQSFSSDNTAGVFSRTFIVNIFSNSLTYTVASSCVCTFLLAVMTIAGLHDFVKVSTSASLKSFLLIICIDAPESTTNSHS